MPAPIPFPFLTARSRRLATADRAANAAVFSSEDEHHHVLRLRDLTLHPSPMFIALLVPVAPLLILAAVLGSIAAAGLAALLLTIAFGCLWRCIETLRGLRLRLSPPAPCFAGDTAMLELCLDNPGRHARWDIGIGGERADRSGALGPSGWLDVPPHSYSVALVPIRTATRGSMALPVVRIETQHPFGVVRALSRWTPPRQLLVYARPEMDGPPLPGHGQGRHGGQPVWLDVATAVGEGDASASTPEAIASRLTAWVLLAERQGRDYGLRLGAVVVPPARGLAHRRRCLQLLGSWDGAAAR
ncbi:hypothetical protein CDN99_21255 [Roseateles aquatilis]|uniref:DUF58 domain-containing protein n=1 Tax=Roseateles aquatilis TaxID=431061 RepID=A0A246IZ45_9BURK|nr:hypothetical protein [Roseateles aquatilis]OWQ85618.1 hypothetical protein CDN99_21255 [Roseateles aquatilis]